MPMTSGRLRSSVLAPQRSRTGGEDISALNGERARRRSVYVAAEGPPRPPRAAPELMLPSRDRRRAARWRRRRRRLVGQAVVPAGRGLGLLAGHDVLQLLIADGLVLHERFGHEVQLVECADQDLARALVVALDDDADLLV